jgi:hypothetical protein
MFEILRIRSVLSNVEIVDVHMGVARHRALPQVSLNTVPTAARWTNMRLAPKNHDNSTKQNLNCIGDCHLNYHKHIQFKLPRNAAPPW